MSEQPQVEALGEHNYLVRVREGEDLIEIRVHASPAVVARVAVVNADENRIIEVKRVYDPSGPANGRRVLVDRIWPRGLTTAAAR
jgi:hypothetical protein